MELAFLSTLFNPGVMFFILGFFAVMVNSNLEIPENIVKYISLYLMMAIGFKGGVALFTTPFALAGRVLTQPTTSHTTSTQVSSFQAAQTAAQASALLVEVAVSVMSMQRYVAVSMKMTNCCSTQMDVASKVYSNAKKKSCAFLDY